MNLGGKIMSFALIILIVTLVFGQLSIVHSDLSSTSPSIEDQALLCLTTVYNIDFNHYDVTPGQSFTLPQGPNDPTVTQATDYFLSAPDSNLVANFNFQDGVLNQFALRVINGSVVQAQNFSNMRAAATDFLTKYQTINPVDMTPLIRLIDMLNQDNTTAATLGNLTLHESSGSLLPGHMATIFTWRNTPDEDFVNLMFENGVFYTFMASPLFTVLDSAQAMNSPLDNSIPASSPSPSVNPTLAEQQQNQNPSTDTNKSLENNFANYAIIAVLSIIIAASVGIIVYLKKHSYE